MYVPSGRTRVGLACVSVFGSRGTISGPCPYLPSAWLLCFAIHFFGLAEVRFRPPPWSEVLLWRCLKFICVIFPDSST